jgi:formylglycine-generating enzyme required for sulfatase activity/predicted phosphodiesterase
MNQSIAWLHLSDWHQKGKEFDRDVVKEDLIRDISERAKIDPSLEKIDFIVFSGDVAQNGKKEEYETAIKQLFEPVLAATRLTAQELFIVPGNHDIDRKQFELLLPNLRSPFKNREESNEWLTDEDKLLEVLKPFRTYSSFVTGYTTQDMPAYAGYKKVQIESGIEVALAGINSALMCGRKNAKGSAGDTNRLVVGEPQVRAAIDKTKNKKIRIAVLHHPFDQLAQFDRTIVEKDIMKHFHFILHGHTHMPGAQLTDDTRGNFAIVSAGTCFESRAATDPHKANSYNFTRIDLSEEKGFIFLRRWDEVEKRWVAQTGARHERGVFSFDLPKELTANSKGKRSALSDPQKYLADLLEECQFIEIRGINVSGIAAHRLDIEKIYAPLYVAGGVEEMQAAFVSKEAMIRHALKKTSLDEVLKHPAVLILGDPGSGKSTYLKRIATILCRSHLAQDPAYARTKLGFDSAPFPILVNLNKLATHIMKYHKSDNPGFPAVDDDSEWLFHYLGRENPKCGLSKEWFEQQCENRGGIFLLDGLDETPDVESRRVMIRLLNRLRRDYSKCRIVVTSRSMAYKDENLNACLKDFSSCDIAPFDDEGINAFLKQWCDELYSGAPASAAAHLKNLQHDVFARPAIRRMAANPVMITGLAIVHWNNKRLPEQRAELYEFIISWLLDSRDMRYAGNVSRGICFELHKALAVAMQSWPGGRQKSLQLGQVLDVLAPHMEDGEEKKRRSRAEQFVKNEELASGIIRVRGSNVEFWHLTFMEFLAARELAGMGEQSQQGYLLRKEIIDDPNWRETLLLFIGILWRQGPKKVEGFFRAMLNSMELFRSGKKPEEILLQEARCFGLMGAMLRDLQPYQYRVEDPRFVDLQKHVEQIFDPQKAAIIPIFIRLAAADALGQAGDHRIVDDLRTEEARNKMFVEIPEDVFLMGAQKTNRKGNNYDEEAYDYAAPVHEAHLSAYKISRYPVTVSQYELFMNEDGYKCAEFWKAGRKAEQDKPDEWEQQLAFPNRPVVGVSWYEAMAFCAWAGLQLPTEAQWERAARGPKKEYRKYPWGNEGIDIQRANFHDTRIDHASAVGCFPAGNAVWDSEKGLWIADMAGNVWEWCRDWFGVYEADDPKDPIGPANGSFRVLRGGSWIDIPRDCRCAFRDCDNPGRRIVDAGFRVVFVPQFAVTHSDLPMSKRSEPPDRS